MKLVNPNSITDMQMFNIKHQARMAQSIQKIGKSKRKVEVSLSKNSQKYLDQMIDEMKKQLAVTSNEVSNISEFFNYLKKQVHVEKGEKRLKYKNFNISYDEQDFLVMQIKSVIAEVEKQRSNLKWYNLIKKIIFSSVLTQNEVLINELRGKK